MNSERLKKIEEIYHAALEIEPVERESFFKKACGADEQLRLEVESLLAYEKTSDHILNASPESLAAEIFSEEIIQDDLTGTEIGRYKIKKLLGRGGMGEVFLAEDRELERLAAIKILPADFSNDAHRVNRFIREAKAVSALNHPNILTIYEIGNFHDSRFIATEYIAGQTLREKMSGESFDLREILDIGRQIAAALSAAHSAAIIHRDIKPENIMLRKDGLVKVLDFGLAKLLESPVRKNGFATNENEAATQKFDLTKPGMIMGTTSYMSPEQVRGQSDIDERADIWSLGIVIFEMLTRRVPFTGDTISDTIAAILKTDTPQLSNYIDDYPAELERIVTRTLQKKREERYQNIKDLVLDLKSLDKEMEFSAEFSRSSHGRDRNVTAEIPKQVTTNIETHKKFSLMNVFAILIVAGLLFGGAWWFFSKNETPQTTSNLKQTEVVNWASAPGEIYSTGAFSPDAKMVAFASTQSGQKNIRVKQTKSGDSVQITKDEFGSKNPVWSPNGEELAFYSTRGNAAGIWRIPILGGTPKLITAIDDGRAVLRFWSKNNSIYFESKDEIFAIDSESGQTRQITDLKSKNIKPLSTNISPDEKRVAYVAVEKKIWSVWTNNLTGDNPVKIFESPAEIKNVFWHSDNRRVFFSSLVDGTFQVFVSGSGSDAPNQLTFGDRDSFAVDVSADGEKILLGAAKEESDIWGIKTDDEKEFTVASDINSELWESVSPDGKTIVYQSIKNPSQGNKLFYGEILTKSFEKETPPVQLSPEGFSPNWSPDGNRIAFMRVVGETYQLVTVQVTGGEIKSLVTDGLMPVDFTALPYNRLQTSDFSWSPDGSGIAYISDRNDFDNIWFVSFDGARNVRLSENNDSNLTFNCPIWSPDGKQIAFTSQTKKSDGKPTYSLWLLDTEKKSSSLLTRQKKFLRLIGYMKNGELLMASTESSGSSGLPTEVSLYAIETQTKEMREIVGQKDIYAYNIRLSDNAKQIAFVTRRDGKDNIWTISSAGGEAKQVTKNNDSKLYFSSLAWSPDNKTIFFGKQTRFSLLSMLTNFK